MPGFLEYLNKLNPLGYSVRNMMPYVLRGHTFSCGDDQRLTDGSCAISTGEQVLEIFNLKDVNAPSESLRGRDQCRCIPTSCLCSIEAGEE